MILKTIPKNIFHKCEHSVNYWPIFAPSFSQTSECYEKIRQTMSDNSHTLIGGTLVHVGAAMHQKPWRAFSAGTGVSLLGEL